MKTKSKNAWHSFRSFNTLHTRGGGKSNTRFCMFPKVKSMSDIAGRAPVYLNVYDLTPANGYVYWAGFGVFHTGVEVHGLEYAFGAHEFSTSGVFEVEPRQCPGFEFRRSIFMGTTNLDPIQVREFMEWQSANYHGDMYHLVVKNCNHFSEDICYKLTGKKIPKWVNRLARVGSLCSCILPETLKSSAVRPDPNFQSYETVEKKKLRSPFGCFASISMNPKEEEREETVSSMFIHSHYDDCLPPMEFKKIH